MHRLTRLEIRILQFQAVCEKIVSCNEVYAQMYATVDLLVVLLPMCVV